MSLSSRFSYSRIRLFFVACAALAAIAYGGCGSSNDSDSDAGPDSGGDDVHDGGVPLPTEIIGRVRVVEYGGDIGASSIVSAEIRAGALPTTQEVVDEDGDCILLDGERTNSWLCDPMCEGDEACINDECVPYPLLAPSGVITIEGLTVEAELEPMGAGHYEGIFLQDTSLFYPGAQIHATSQGGETPAFSMSAVGVEPLESDVAQVDWVQGEDIVYTWEPPTQSIPGSRIQLLIQTGWHGAPSLTTLWCETDDDGEITIPASITEQIPIPSCGECEMSYLTRFTRDIVDFGDGPIELFVGSSYQFVPWWGALQ